MWVCVDLIRQHGERGDDRSRGDSISSRWLYRYSFDQANSFGYCFLLRYVHAALEDKIATLPVYRY